MSAPEPYSAEELVTLRTSSSYQTRANARWFATLAAAARARDAEVRELVEAARASVNACRYDCGAGSFCGQCEPLVAVLAKHPEAR